MTPEYPAAERLIFWFKDGGRRRAVDPLLVERVLHDAFVDLDMQSLLGSLDAGGREYVAAAEKILPAIQAAFGVKPLDDDGNGMTTVEQIELMAQFFEWVSEKKADTGTPPNGSPPTDGPPAVSATPAPAATEVIPRPPAAEMGPRPTYPVAPQMWPPGPTV